MIIDGIKWWNIALDVTDGWCFIIWFYQIKTWRLSMSTSLPVAMRNGVGLIWLQSFLISCKKAFNSDCVASFGWNIPGRKWDLEIVITSHWTFYHFEWHASIMRPCNWYFFGPPLWDFPSSYITKPLSVDFLVRVHLKFQYNLKLEPFIPISVIRVNDYLKDRNLFFF